MGQYHYTFSGPSLAGVFKGSHTHTLCIHIQHTKASLNHYSDISEHTSDVLILVNIILKCHSRNQNLVNQLDEQKASICLKYFMLHVMSP